MRRQGGGCLIGRCRTLVARRGALRPLAKVQRVGRKACRAKLLPQGFGIGAQQVQCFRPLDREGDLHLIALRDQIKANAAQFGWIHQKFSMAMPFAHSTLVQMFDHSRQVMQSQR